MAVELVLFSLVLSIDSFSAALALGFRHFSPKRALFFALSSGLTEGLATAIGFLLGHIAQQWITAYDHWVAFFLLCAVGIHMCYHAYQEMNADHPPTLNQTKVHGLFKILFVSTITSIDSFGVGISLGLLNKPIMIYSLAIGLAAFLSTYLGLYLAKQISTQFGEKIEFMGGVILILIGVKMLSI
jgi:manganese efflux pump family protein